MRGQHFIVIGFLLFLSSFLVVFSYYFVLKNSDVKDTVPNRTFSWHVAMVTSNAEEPFWQETYQAARSRGEELDAYVELFGNGLAERYTVEELMAMAVYSSVDAIMVEPVEGEAMHLMLEKARDASIPVITLRKDISSSSHQGFVGTNDYFLGQDYGRRILKIAAQGTSRVAVLMPAGSFEGPAQEWFTSGLRNTVAQYGITAEIYPVMEDDGGLNNAEEVVRGLLSNGTVPDIIVCLNAPVTTTVWRVLRANRPLSARIKIIGAEMSSALMEGIRNNEIDSVITINPLKLGTMAVDALSAYRMHGMVSYYTEVGSEIVDRENVDTYAATMQGVWQ